MIANLDRGVIVPTLETEQIRRAFEFAYRLHQNQYRKTGEPFINHPIRVANYVREYKAQCKDLEVLIVAALLHDTTENTSLTYYDLVEFFGATVASLVLELTTDEDMKKAIGKTRYLEIKLKNMSSWALTLKLCDRLDNCSDLHLCDEAFRIKYRDETIEILEYLLANRSLGNTQKRLVMAITMKLEDYIAPDEVWLRNKLKKLKEQVDCQKEKTLEFGRVVDMKNILLGLH